MATAIVGLVVAILTGRDSFFRYGLRWQQLRQHAAEIEAEGWGFLELSGPYAKYQEHKAALTPFLGRLEAINNRHATSYLDIFRSDDTTHRPRPGGGTA